jgi:hypothetical protein
LSDGNAAHGSSASVVEVMKAIEQIFPKAPNFAFQHEGCQLQCGRHIANST